MTKTLRLVALTAACGLVATACDYFYTPFVNRIDSPVVLTGADIPQALGIDPTTGVGYRWSADDSSWTQFPIQVDERHVVGFGSAPGNNSTPGTSGTVYGNGATGVTALQYSDGNTFVGADPDITFDADDELAFMSRDVGDQAPAGTSPPAGVTSLGLELEVTDPTSGSVGYAYLFVDTTSPDPSAGLDYVDYDFVLDSGDYISTYLRADGPNPESSTVSTPGYELGFSDRWIHDDLSIDGGVDILDGHKSQFQIGFCGRSNLTFADAEGAFVANIDGPVRGIRSYIGANSGPLTQRTFHFYRDRYEITTDLRVHSIPSVMSFLDFSDEAIGMTQGRSTTSATVTIDGSADSVPSFVPDWVYVTGTQGSLLVAAQLTTTASVLEQAFYLDDDTPPPSECWGDGQYLGSVGNNIVGGIPNTDPRFSSFDTFQSFEVLMPLPPDVGAAAYAPVWYDAVSTDLVINISPF